MYEFRTRQKLLPFLTLETDFTYHHRDAYTLCYKTKEIIFYIYALRSFPFHSEWVVHVSGSNFINDISKWVKNFERHSIA